MDNKINNLSKNNLASDDYIETADKDKTKEINEKNKQKKKEEKNKKKKKENKKKDKEDGNHKKSLLNKCSYKGCLLTNLQPVKCGLCQNDYVHHLCQNQCDSQYFNGLFENSQGCLFRCYQCFLSELRTQLPYVQTVRDGFISLGLDIDCANEVNRSKDGVEKNTVRNDNNNSEDDEENGSETENNDEKSHNEDAEDNVSLTKNKKNKSDEKDEEGPCTKKNKVMNEPKQLLTGVTSVPLLNPRKDTGSKPPKKREILLREQKMKEMMNPNIPTLYEAKSRTPSYVQVIQKFYPNDDLSEKSQTDMAELFKQNVYLKNKYMYAIEKKQNGVSDNDLKLHWKTVRFFNKNNKESLAIKCNYDSRFKKENHFVGKSVFEDNSIKFFVVNEELIRDERLFTSEFIKNVKRDVHKEHNLSQKTMKIIKDAINEYRKEFIWRIKVEMIDGSKNLSDRMD